jgi:hypothetical protein
MYNYHSNYLTFGKKGRRGQIMLLCSREVGYHTKKVVKCLWNLYHQACQASFINNRSSEVQKGSKGLYCTLSCNPDQRRFHVLDHIRRLATACRKFLNIMSRGAGIMLASLVSLYDFPINPGFLRAILLI